MPEKIDEIQKTVNETKKIMEDNIDKLLERQKKLDSIKEKTETLKNETESFRINAEKIRLKEKNRHYEGWFIKIFGCLGIIVSILCQQAWPVHIMMFIIFAGIGRIINWIRDKIELAWVGAKNLNLSLNTEHERSNYNKPFLKKNHAFTPLADLKQEQSSFEGKNIFNNISFFNPLKLLYRLIP